MRFEGFRVEADVCVVEGGPCQPAEAVPRLRA
jgi:hypothetical protein